MLDSRFTDADADETPAALLDPENLDPENDDDGAPETDGGAAAGATATATGQTIADFEQRAAGSTGCVRSCSSPRWQPTYRRTPTAAGHPTGTRPLGGEARRQTGALHTLLTQQYPHRKALVFSQFTDTVRYLEAELRRRCVRQLARASPGIRPTLITRPSDDYPRHQPGRRLARL